MSRTDFINKLRSALNGKVPSTIIEDNVKYYDEYIDAELSKGVSEEEILQLLGDPRLIAKTIIEANKHAEESSAYGRNSEYDYDGEGASSDKSLISKVQKWPNWLKTALSVIGVALFLVIMSSIITTVLPVLIVVFLGIYIYRRFIKR